MKTILQIMLFVIIISDGLQPYLLVDRWVENFYLGKVLDETPIPLEEMPNIEAQYMVIDGIYYEVVWVPKPQGDTLC